jgi:hypothetical protein
MWYKKGKRLLCLELLFFFLLIFLLTGIEAVSQPLFKPPAKQWSVTLGGLLNHLSATEEKFSRRPFHAFMPGLVISAKYHRYTTQHELAGSYTKGISKAGISPNQKLNISVLTIDYSNLYRIHQSSSGRLLSNIGGSLQWLQTERSFRGFVNSGRSYEVAASLGVVNEWIYSFPQVWQGLNISNRISIPFLFLFSQSPYTANNFSEEESKLNNFIQDNEITSVKKIFRLKNCLSVTGNLNDRQSLTLSYSFDCYKISAPRKVMQVSHQLIFSYTYILQP